jgi:hypothetical protein
MYHLDAVFTIKDTLPLDKANCTRTIPPFGFEYEKIKSKITERNTSGTVFT